MDNKTNNQNENECVPAGEASAQANVSNESVNASFTNGYDVQENVSLGSFSDTAIAEGVASTGILGDIKVENPTISDDEKKELINDGIVETYKDEPLNDEEEIASEFGEMSNVINGQKRKPRKKRKRKTKVRKIVVRTYATIFIAVICIVIVYFGATMFQQSPAQGLTGADLIVEMSGLPHMIGVKGDIEFKKMFPNGSNFKNDGTAINDDGEDGKLKENNISDGFTLTYDETIEDNVIEITREVQIVDGAINVSDWDAFDKAINDAEIICMQTAYIAAPPRVGMKKKDAEKLAFTLKNDIYGNGCKINVFEIVCCRGKLTDGKLAAPYLQGKGAMKGASAFTIEPREDNDDPILMQDLHIIGNDMDTGEGGNLAGVSETILEKRGLNLFSNYGYLIGLSGDYSKGIKANFKLKHCVLENGHQIMHIRYSDVELEGNIIRNASDTTMSVATYANEKSIIKSKNNVISNSLTGGVVFYCYDDKINANNAEDSWNELIIEKGTFLDIYNWKPQDGLAFMPETEGGQEIANPVAKSEIPKKAYDNLKADVDGQKYIHFAIIKLRTGNGLPINGSKVVNFEDIGYQTTKDKGYPNGFPLPSIAAAIIKDIDVWGYYEKSDLDVKPTDILDVETLSRLYGELKNGRVRN